MCGQPAELLRRCTGRDGLARAGVGAELTGEAMRVVRQQRKRWALAKTTGAAEFSHEGVH